MSDTISVKTDGCWSFLGKSSQSYPGDLHIIKYHAKLYACNNNVWDTNQKSKLCIGTLGGISK